jgi:hypothetical protein
MVSAWRFWRSPALLVLISGLFACGGGGGSGGRGDDSSSAPPPPPQAGVQRVMASGPSLVAAGCRGGQASGTVFTNAEVEPMAAVSPLNPDWLVGTWQQDRASDGGALALATAVSSDGGRSWQRTLHPLSRCGGAAPGSAGDFERASDPWVDIGPTGTVYLMGLAFSGAILSPGSSSAMLVRRSTDGGLSWGDATTLQRDGDSLFNDKNTLSADPTDARFVYAVWDRLDADGNGPTLLARSVDGGLHWEPTRTLYNPQAAGGVSQTIGNRIVVLTDGPERGLLVNAFVQIDTVGTQSTTRVRVMRSADQGLTWDEPTTVATSTSVGTRDPDTGTAVRDGGILPTVATGPGGQLWTAWQDARFSNGARDAIAVSRSSDGGRSWSAPVAVNREPGVAAFTPTLHVRADGLVALMHYDLRSNTTDRSSLLADLWLLTTRDGVNWTETALERRFDLLRAPSATGGLFLGDYHGLVSTRGRFVALAGVPGPDSGNRSDVLALGTDGPAGAVFAARTDRRQARSAFEEARLHQAASDATARWMDQRLPGWRARVQRAPGAPRVSEAGPACAAGPQAGPGAGLRPSATTGRATARAAPSCSAPA